MFSEGGAWGLGVVGWQNGTECWTCPATMAALVWHATRHIKAGLRPFLRTVFDFECCRMAGWNWMLD